MYSTIYTQYNQEERIVPYFVYLILASLKMNKILIFFEFDYTTMNVRF